MITKLMSGDKSMIRQIVGRVHVYDSDENVVAYVKSRMDLSAASPGCVRQIERQAIKEHAANRKLVRDFRL